MPPRMACPRETHFCAKNQNGQQPPVCFVPGVSRLNDMTLKAIKGSEA